ncbi:hypothetical protein [Massilia sp. CCM 8734]|uniref:hypothetical protein n=1 Tax=Massilia sp. CCM 8734 TaxID=2609283 RepID=UPI00142382A7|nr:hypothetical protein [Massilia sp. CCM 8734]NHZ94924.1 hypothetical protein [Massilia sp. CCM 8734]
MLSIHDSLLRAGDGHACRLRSLAWPGAAIVDACAVDAPYGQLLVLTADGALHGVDPASGAVAELCRVALPAVPAGAGANPARLRLHASLDGAYAAIVLDRGQAGVVLETRSGKITLRLGGENYHAAEVPFSACFLRHEGRNVFVHRSEWNRLDAADAASGESLAERHIAHYESGKEQPRHYLDFFHGRLCPSPDGSRMFNDGWVWASGGMARAWSVTGWLGANPWETEDGASAVILMMRDGWDYPACWIDERHIALWNIADEEDPHVNASIQEPGVYIVDATRENTGTPERKFPMEMDKQADVLDLFCDGKRIIVAAATETSIWDLASRARVAVLPGFSARFHDAARAVLVAVGPHAIVEWPLAWADRA